MTATALNPAGTPGIEALDVEHRKLTAAIEDLCNSFENPVSRRSVSECFTLLERQVSVYFAAEENLLREYQPRLYDAHRREHDRLLEQLRHMSEAYEAGECEDCGTQLRACLDAWLSEHARSLEATMRSGTH